MNPGATIRSEASMTFLAPVVTLPISAIWPLATATSARYRGAPVPSTTVPFLMSRSYDIANLLQLQGSGVRGRGPVFFFLPAPDPQPLAPFSRLLCLFLIQLFPAWLTAVTRHTHSRCPRRSTARRARWDHPGSRPRWRNET